MEVHHHGHVHERKKWKEYLFQFFMLFLAITLGFWVENQREHYIEHVRAKEYAQLLYDDLKKDSANLHNIIDIKERRRGKIDTLVINLKEKDLQKRARQIYYYSSFLSLNLPFSPSDATIQQMRNSGNLRYFRNLKLYNLATQYYSNCQFYSDREKDGNIRFPEYLVSRIFDAEKISGLVTITPDIRDAVRFPVDSIALLSTDPVLINELKLIAGAQQNSNSVSLFLLNGIIGPSMRDLMAALRQEYHVH